MLDNRKDWAIGWGKAIVICGIALVLFEGAIRPVLIDLHPMFAEQYELGRRYSTPAGVGYLLTIGLCYFIWLIIDIWISTDQSSWD